MKKEFTDVDFEMFIMPFGGHQGKSLEELPASYVLWFLDQENCPPTLKAWAELHEEELTEKKEAEELEKALLHGTSRYYR